MKKENHSLELIKLSNKERRKQMLSNGTWMPRGSVHNKKRAKDQRLDARYIDAKEDHSS